MARVNKIANVIIPASDQDRMLEFYTEALEKRANLPFGEGGRWIEVAPPLASQSGRNRLVVEAG